MPLEAGGNDPYLDGMTQHYDYTHKLKSLWTGAVGKYREGIRGAENFFSPEERKFIASIGATEQEIYDFAEDAVKYGEPDFTTFTLLQDVRRAYFLEEQKGRPGGRVLDIQSLPAKTDAVEGIVWLPRIIPKARAKIRGELHPDIMYGCGGDRNFFRENDIHPAEFLRIVWKAGDNDAEIVDWVKKRRAEL
jgi:hypothetical protein